MQRIMRLLKSFIVWICFIPVAILNGGLREYVLVQVYWRRNGITRERDIAKRIHLSGNMADASPVW